MYSILHFRIRDKETDEACMDAAHKRKMTTFEPLKKEECTTERKL